MLFGATWLYAQDEKVPRLFDKKLNSKVRQQIKEFFKAFKFYKHLHCIRKRKKLQKVIR